MQIQRVTGTNMRDALERAAGRLHERAGGLGLHPQQVEAQTLGGAPADAGKLAECLDEGLQRAGKGQPTSAR